jgi:hypothetical protein
MYAVGVRCDDDAAAMMNSEIERTKQVIKGTKDLPGVGKAAIITKQAPLGNSVTAFDDDSNCRLSFILPASVDPTAFAKDMLALLPIE